MRYSTALLGFVAGTVAIDGYLQTGSNCDGTGVVWTNMNPGVNCLVPPSGFGANSARYRAIPSGWVITGFTFSSNGCSGNQNNRVTGTGPGDLCIPRRGTEITGTRYNSGTTKRSDAVAERAVAGPQDCLKPNLLVLRDGTTTFNITGLEERAMRDLVDFAMKDLPARDVPEQFKSLAIAADV